MSLHQNFLYIIGGGVPRNQTSTCEKLNIETGESAYFATLPFTLALHSAVVVSNQIFTAGGLSLNCTDQIVPILCYDISSDRWRRTEISYIKAIKPALVRVSEKYLFIFGGWAKESHIVNKSFAVDLVQEKSVVLNDFIEGEVYESHCINGKILKACDSIGCIHTFHVPTIQRSIHFALSCEKKWDGRKYFLFALKYAASARIFSIPNSLITEIARIL